MPVIVPCTDPRALKPGNLGRYVRCWRFHVELVRQRDDRFRIDRERLGLSVVHQAHEYHRNYRHQVAHPITDHSLACAGSIAARRNQALWRFWDDIQPTAISTGCPCGKLSTPVSALPKGVRQGYGRRKARSSALHQIADIAVSRFLHETQTPEI